METRDVLTKFERAKIIGIRMEQLSRGAPPNVPLLKGDDVRAIAVREFVDGKLPLMVSRSLPHGKTETLKLSGLRDVSFVPLSEE